MEPELPTGRPGRIGRAVALAALLAAIASAGAAVLWVAFRPLPTPRPKDASPAATVRTDDGYVGSTACAECHRGIADAYAGHPMARSIARVSAEDEELKGPANTRVPGKTRLYDVAFENGRMVHHDRMYDAAGDLIYDQAMPVDYVVGSGRRAKAYVHRRGELMFMSPLNWYSATRRWDVAPGYAPDDPRRFGRRITDDCLSCHAGRLAPLGASLNRYADPPFHEMAIGCENCHGPGAGHVAFRSSGEALSGGSDPIVNPAGLDPERRDSVCYQCHLQAVARVPRAGRDDLDFVPGDLFRDVWTAVDRGSEVTADGRTRSVNHVQQMRDSRCFRESDGRLGCVSCHDPHRVPAETERVSFYRDRCLTCHTDASCTAPADQRRQRDDSCVACHMPARDSSNVSHVTQTDHRVLRRPDAASDAPRPGSADAADGLALFDQADRSLPDWERDRALALGAWTHLSTTDRLPPTSLATLLDGLLRHAPNDGKVLVALGAMATAVGRGELARTYFERARRVPEAEEQALSGLLDIYAATDPARGLACADRLLEIDPWDARTHAVRAELLETLGRRDEGIAAAERAIALNPTLIPLRRWLANAYRAAGRVDAQQAQESIITRMEGARVPE